MKKAVSIFILVCFFVTGQIGASPVYAQDFALPAPGAMVQLSPAFNPPILTGIKVHPDNPFRFDFILDQGDRVIARSEATKQSQQEQLKIESTKLIKYFLASITIPEKDLWVNLSPYEKDRIIPQSFGLTEMGRDLLAEDYMLKQITASLIYPEGETGRKFWKRIYEEAEKKFGTTNIPVNTFNKVWIVPEKAVVYENTKAGTAYVVEAKLKVMLEQDYLALSKNVSKGPIASTSSVVSLRGGEAEEAISKRTTKNDVNALGSQVVREIIIPELTREVNEGRNFVQLRQVYNSLILATWYKKKIKDSVLEKIYADKNKVKGLSFPNVPPGRDPAAAVTSIGNPEHIYQQYLQAFKKGVYNYIKEDQDPMAQETIPRKYFSGGFTGMFIDQAMSTTSIQPKQRLGLMIVSSYFQRLGTLIKGRLVRNRELEKSLGDRQAMWGEPMQGEDKNIRSQLIDLIDAEVKNAYKYASRKYRKDQTTGIWRVGVCRRIRKFLFDKFKGANGIDIKVVIYNTEFKPLTKDVFFHDFIIIFYRGRAWILDPAWQQFLNKGEGSANLPKVLLVEVTRLNEKLDAMGVLKNNRYYWYSALIRDPDVMKRVNREHLYHKFSLYEPQTGTVIVNEDEKRKDTGGIDLTINNLNLQTQNAGEGIKFYLKPAMFQQFQNSPGFVPVIVDIQPMSDLKSFLESR